MTVLEFFDNIWLIVKCLSAIFGLGIGLVVWFLFFREHL